MILYPTLRPAVSCVSILAALATLPSCDRQDDPPEPPTMPTTVDYLALGDSYTIGQSVEAAASFPLQLAVALEGNAGPAVMPTVIARTGWRSDDLLAALDRENPAGARDLVSVLIGVNDQFQGRTVEGFRQNLRLLLDRAVALADDGAGDVLVVTIPDYSATPFAAQLRDTMAIRQALERFNAVVVAEATARGIPVVDITPGSKRAREDASLLAPDGLHPSGEQYAEWVEQILPVAREVIAD